MMFEVSSQVVPENENHGRMALRSCKVLQGVWQMLEENKVQWQLRNRNHQSPNARR